MRTLQGSASAGAHGLPAPHWHALEQCSRERPEPAVAIIPRWKVRFPMKSKHQNNIDEFLLLRFFPSRAAVSFQSLRIRLCCEHSHFAVQFPLGALGLPEPSRVTDFVHGLETCIARTADGPALPRHRPHAPATCNAAAICRCILFRGLALSCDGIRTAQPESAQPERSARRRRMGSG